MNNKKNNYLTTGSAKGGDIAQYDELGFRPLEIEVNGMNFEKAFKIFRAIVQKERILSLYKEKQSFEKPSEKKRRKKNEAARRELEAEAKSKKFADTDK